MYHFLSTKDERALYYAHPSTAHMEFPGSHDVGPNFNPLSSVIRRRPSQSAKFPRSVLSAARPAQSDSPSLTTSLWPSSTSVPSIPPPPSPPYPPSPPSSQPVAPATTVTTTTTGTPTPQSGIGLGVLSSRPAAVPKQKRLRKPAGPGSLHSRTSSTSFGREDAPREEDEETSFSVPAVLAVPAIPAKPAKPALLAAARDPSLTPDALSHPPPPQPPPVPASLRLVRRLETPGDSLLHIRDTPNPPSGTQASHPHPPVPESPVLFVSADPSQSHRPVQQSQSYHRHAFTSPGRLLVDVLPATPAASAEAAAEAPATSGAVTLPPVASAPSIPAGACTTSPVRQQQQYRVPRRLDTLWARMPASVRHPHNKQLPPAPRINTTLDGPSTSLGRDFLFPRSAGGSSAEPLSAASSSTPGSAANLGGIGAGPSGGGYGTGATPGSRAWLEPERRGAPSASTSSSAAVSALAPRPPTSPVSASGPRIGTFPSLTSADGLTHPYAAAGAAGSPAGQAHHERFPGHQNANMVADPGAVPKTSSGLAGGSSGAFVSGMAATSGVAHPSHQSQHVPARLHSPNQAKLFVRRNGRTFLADPTIKYPLPVDLAEVHRQTLRTLMLFQVFGGPICSPAFHDRPPRRVLEIGCGSGFWSMMCYRYYQGRGDRAEDIKFTGLDIAPLAPASTNPACASMPEMSSTSTTSTRATTMTGSAEEQPGPADKGMDWRFVQHDIRQLPWPFRDNEFDLIMFKDTCLMENIQQRQSQVDEWFRILMPGGTLELWDSDFPIRMLRPHNTERMREPGTSSLKPGAGRKTGEDANNGSDSEEDEEAERASTKSNVGSRSSMERDSNDDDDERRNEAGGAKRSKNTTRAWYKIDANTPLSAPLNSHLVDYNAWVTKALETRGLSPVPCTLLSALLIQESETLMNIGSRRLAIPLSEVRWEREGVGGVVNKGGKTYIEFKGKGSSAVGLRKRSAAAGAETDEEIPRLLDGGFGDPAKALPVLDGDWGWESGEDRTATTAAALKRQNRMRALDATAAALRRTALITVVQLIQSLEPALREVNGKNQDEWDTWFGKMMNDLVKGAGASWGECLEVGAWWAQKRAG